MIIVDGKELVTEERFCEANALISRTEEGIKKRYCYRNNAGGYVELPIVNSLFTNKEGLVYQTLDKKLVEAGL